jgi:manganese transport protein
MSNKNSESLSEVHGSVITSGKTGWRKLMAFIGPAYLVSVGYMDPGNWATDIAGGSQFGYKLIWVLLMSNLMALLLQSLSARLGIVRGLDLAQASRNTYPSYINYPLYLLAQIAKS